MVGPDRRRRSSKIDFHSQSPDKCSDRIPKSFSFVTCNTNYEKNKTRLKKALKVHDREILETFRGDLLKLFETFKPQKLHKFDKVFHEKFEIS